MTVIAYPLAFGSVVFGIAIAAAILERHFVARIFATELMLFASCVTLMSFFSYSKSPNGDGIMMLMCIWAVAAVECVVLVATYTFMKYRGIELEPSEQGGKQRRAVAK